MPYSLSKCCGLHYCFWITHSLQTLAKRRCSLSDLLGGSSSQTPTLADLKTPPVQVALPTRTNLK
jgi:hypothetical protein